MSLTFSQAFRETMFRFDLKGVDIANRAGVKPGQVSTLRNGGNLTLETFEKIINALPHDARNHLFHLLSEECA
jgi:DNA-binding Xre family transcriptional regulator